MAKVKVKVIATVDISQPNIKADEKATEVNEAIRTEAIERVTDALKHAELNPHVLRARIAKKG